MPLLNDENVVFESVCGEYRLFADGTDVEAREALMNFAAPPPPDEIQNLEGTALVKLSNDCLEILQAPDDKRAKQLLRRMQADFKLDVETATAVVTYWKSQFEAKPFSLDVSHEIDTPTVAKSPHDKVIATNFYRIKFVLAKARNFY